MYEGNMHNSIKACQFYKIYYDIFLNVKISSILPLVLKECQYLNSDTCVILIMFYSLYTCNLFQGSFQSCRQFSLPLDINTSLTI